MSTNPDVGAQIISLHFELIEHSLPLNEFIDTALSAQEIIHCFNNQFFEGHAQYEIVVLPPIPGTFTSLLAIRPKLRKAALVTGAIGGSLLWFIESDVGKGYVKGLTGHEPAYWAAQLGESHNDTIEHLIDPGEVEKQHECAMLILAETTKGFLEKDSVSLRKSDISKQKFYDAYKARNQFYQACFQYGAIEGVGFDGTDNFPVKRNNFLSYVVDLPRKEEELLNPNWLVGIEFVYVTSPNWDREDDQRGWKGKGSDGKTIFFSIEDEEFWKLVQSVALHTKVVDVLKVQWAFSEGNGNKKNIRVLRVLEFNQDIISEPLDDRELRVILKNYDRPPVSPAPEQISLFDDS